MTWDARLWTAPLADPNYRASVWLRLVSNVEVDTASGCWLWQLARWPDGYGAISVKRRMARAHIVSLMIHTGEAWPADLHVDHLCRTPPCVNPLHLEVVTADENARRGIAALVNGRHNTRKTHCPQGHAYAGTNLHIDPRGWRKCRACGAAASRRARQGEGPYGEAASYIRRAVE